MKRFLLVALLAGGLILTTVNAASAHTATLKYSRTCTEEGETKTVVTFDNNHGLKATVHYHWGLESPSTIDIAARPSNGSNTTAELPEHAVGTLKYYVTWENSTVRQPTSGEATEEILPLTDCHATTTSSTATTSSTTSSTTTSTTTTTLAPTIVTPTVAPAVTEAPIVTEVKGIQLTAPGPAPVGGVQTGGGGASQSSNQLLPLGLALALVGFVGLVTMQVRRRIG